VSITFLRALTVAVFPAIIVVSLTQLASASSLHQTELPGVSSNMFGMAAYSSPYLAAAVAPKSTSGDGSDATFDTLSGLLGPLGGNKSATEGAAGDPALATPGLGSYSYGSGATDTGRQAVDSVLSIGGSDLYLGNSPVTAKGSLSQGERESFGSSAEQAATGRNFEVSPGVAMAPSSEVRSFPQELGSSETPGYDSAGIGYLAMTGSMNGARGGNYGEDFHNPPAMSFTASVPNVPEGRILGSLQAVVPEPESVGTTLAALVLMLGAFRRRAKLSRETGQ
jgi:hypothetical protein